MNELEHEPLEAARSARPAGATVAAGTSTAPAGSPDRGL